MSTEDLLRNNVTLSPDPASYWPKPSSERTQDISHLLTSLFKDLYTGEVIGKDTGANLIRSKGGDNPYHQKFVEELQQVRAEHEHRLAEADMVEAHIIQARARSASEEERILTGLKDDAGKAFQALDLPPVDSYFRWCVDNKLLKKHKLICPDDYMTDVPPLTEAPKGSSEPSYCKETFSFRQRVSRSPVDDGYHDPELPESEELDLDTSMSDLTFSSTSDVLEQRKKRPSRKSRTGKQIPVKQGMNAEDREQERSQLAQLEKRHNFLKNPRFFPPNSTHGGRSLIVPTRRTDRMISGRKRVVETNDPQEPVPVFLANPPVVFFPDYEVGQIYEMAVELRNMTASSRHVRVIPPSTPYFSIGLGKFPGEGGIVAPGMSCQYTVRFVPDSLADFEDFVLVETQAPYPVLVPIEARRAPPAVTLPRTLDCGPCLSGGVKLIEWICRNDGLSRGRFCIMPKSSWPPASFRSVTSVGFVEKGPFGIRPAYFELYPGEETVIEVAFFPSSPEKYTQVFTIACDNCQVKDFTLTGYGQLVGLEVLSVGQSTVRSGNGTSRSPVHLIHFPPANLGSSTEKSLVIRNVTHVALPFYWQITQPDSQTLLPGETADSARREKNEDTRTAFSISPTQGVLGPHQVHTFCVTYDPAELAEHHGIAQMLIQDVPDASRAQKLTDIQASLKDLIVLDVELKGFAEEFKMLLVPYTIILPGKGFIGKAMRKQFQMWNNSRAAVHFKWETITSRHIIQIEPSTGRIEPGTCAQFELSFTGGRIGFTSQNVKCHIEHSPEPVILSVQATFKESPFTFSPESGELHPLGTAKLRVLFQPRVCGRLQSTLELEVENGESSYLLVTASVQLPQICLLSSSLDFTDIYVGVPAQRTITIFNQGHLPAAFTWGELIGPHSALCSSSVSPASGTLGPNEEMELRVDLTAHTLDELNDLAVKCMVEDMVEPLGLVMKVKAQGLRVSYSLSDKDETSPDELLLDFGSQVALQSSVQRKLILKNHTGISAAFSVQADYFSGSSVPKAQENHTSAASLIRRTTRFTEQAAKRAQAEYEASILSDGKGAAFVPRPRSGTLGAYQEVCIEVTAYSNMWGEYTDQLICTVGDITPREIPVKMSVTGCPVYFQMTGPRQSQGPVIRFGAHVSGGDTISRCLRLNNPSPCDIRIDWETYNKEQDTAQLVDLLLLFGEPFPLKDIDGNEIVTSRSEISESLESVGNWDKIPYTPGSASQASSGIEQGLEAEEPTGAEEEEPVRDEAEEGVQCVEESPLENKLVSVILRSHEGVASDYPYCITPRQTIVPAGGSSIIHVSFTPLILSGVNKTECSGFALGFMSLDEKFVRSVPGKVTRAHRYGVDPIKMELQAFVHPALLTVEIENDDEDVEGLVFYSVASDLIPDSMTSRILTEFQTFQSLKLLNHSETPLYFRLLLPKPFAVSAIDIKSVKTSQSDRDEQGEHMVLEPQQNTLVKVSFCTTLELLTYQSLPVDQMPPGVRVLQSENGEKKLHFSQELLIEYSNKHTQCVSLNAFLTLPVLQLSQHTVDFGTCFVGQTTSQEVYLLNKSGSKSYWTALLDKRQEQEIFSVSPNSGMLDANVSRTSASNATLQVTFTARADTEYEAIVWIHGKLGEQPLQLRMRGHGSYNEKYDIVHKL
uniref:DLEC1 cilia and flagella associated protein n=1 Tax=Leptobrachium leishanense TaxID=445787 RepID=A0A8C5QKX5_9ANUR